jgi:predicted phosphate transport protein (TIGR00153 family)
MSILLPREDRFYALIEAAAANMTKGAEMLVAMLSDYTDIQAKARAIKDVEHEGDELTHDTYEQLNRIFVTPLDREDIGAISSALDDVLDLVEAAADDFVLCSIEEPLPPALEMAQLIVQACVQIQQAVAYLRRLNRDRAAFRDRLTEINRLENQGDDVYRNAIQTLFRQSDPLLILKWKQVYDHLERAIDSCEDVADVLHGVLLKYA